MWIELFWQHFMRNATFSENVWEIVLEETVCGKKLQE